MRLIDCRAPKLRSRPVSRRQRTLRKQESQPQHGCHSSSQQSQRHNIAVRAAAATAELETKKATVKIGTRGSPLALAQAYMTRDFLKAGSRSPYVTAEPYSDALMLYHAFAAFYVCA